MIQITCTSPCFTCIFSTCRFVTVILRLVILTDIGSCQLVGHAVVGLSREMQPVAVHTGTMVDDNILDDSHPLRGESLNHRAQLCLCTKGTLMVEPIDGMIAHIV